MTRPISDWRIARSFIGQGTASTIEQVELEFNLSTKEAIEIASVLGIINPFAVTAATSIVPLVAQQSLHIEEGTLQVLSIDPTDVDQFDTDHEVIFEQKVGMIAFDGTTEGGAALSGENLFVPFARPMLSPINLTHRAENNGASTNGMLMLIHYRYVELTDRELAFQFARRRR